MIEYSCHLKKMYIFQKETMIRRLLMLEEEEEEEDVIARRPRVFRDRENPMETFDETSKRDIGFLKY